MALASSTEPIAKIVGEHEQYVNTGSTINLTCVIEIDPDEPRYILWYHNDQVSALDDPVAVAKPPSQCEFIVVGGRTLLLPQ